MVDPNTIVDPVLEIDYPHRALKNKGIVDSGCSRHMTGNKAYLDEFQDFNGGPVAFGGELACLIAKATTDESNKWHRRLGHVNFKNLNKLVKGNLVRGLPLKIFQNDHTCVACQKGKQHKASCKAKLQSLRTFKPDRENQLNQKVKTLLEVIMVPIYETRMVLIVGQRGNQEGISTPETPQQNGVAERKNRTLIEAARTMLADSFLPNTFWAEAVSTACYVLNRVNKKLTKMQVQREEDQVFMDELERLKKQEKEAYEEAEALRKKFETLVIKEGATKPSSTNIFSTVSTPAKASMADFTNLETVVNVSPIPTSRIHHTHPKALILGDPNSAVQTRSKEISGALEDESWVDAMQEELLQFWRYRSLGFSRFALWGSNEISWWVSFEALMKSRFQMSSMGELTFFLGLQVKQKPDGIFISQDKYVAKILKKFDFANVKTASTPIETQKPLVKDEEASDVDVHLYRSMIGSLMYLTASRPDIMFAVCACSRFQVTPKTSHLSAVKRIFRYLKGKPKLGLWYPRVSSFDLKSYSDSDYAGANLDRKSTTGEAEYVAAASCYGQVLWIQNQMLDYGFNFMNTKIYIDNESTICIVKNPVYHSKTKHIAIRHHFIEMLIEKETHLWNAEFHEIIDFLKRSSIHHALTISPVVSTTFVEQFWTSAKSKTINNVRHITAKSSWQFESISEGINKKESPLCWLLCWYNNSGWREPLSERTSEALPTPSPAPTSEVPLEPQPDSSPAQTSEVPIEHQPTLSPRPSPTTTIPDSIPEPSGENLGGHSSSDRSLSGNEAKIPKKELLQENIGCTKSLYLNKGGSLKRCINSSKKIPLCDEDPEDTIIEPKDKGKKKIKEEDESKSESDGIPQAEKKFKQLESDEELARKMQEEWEEEEERNKIAEDKQLPN
ncbi:putative ribonuclease H-like domain-containing protein [Tanacetum coccineum]